MTGEEHLRGRLSPALVLVSVVTLWVVRVWFPSLQFTLVDGAAPLVLVLAVAAVIVAMAAPALVLATRRHRESAVLRAAVAILAAGRMVLHLPLGGVAQLTVSSVALIAGVVALGLLAGRAGPRADGLVSVHLGVVLEAVGHLALGTHDLVWRTDPTALLISATVVFVLLLATRRCTATPHMASSLHDADPPPPTDGAAWPWLLTGPVVLLVGVLAGAPARTLIAVGVGDGVAAASLAAALLLGAVAAIASLVLGAGRAGIAGAVLVLVGTAGALLPDGRNAVLAQVLLGVGVGVVVGAAAIVPGRSTPMQRGLAVVGSWLLLAVGVVLYYGIHGVTLRVPARTVLLLTAVGVAVVGALAARRVRRARGAHPASVAAGSPRGRRARALPVLLVGVVVLSLLTGLAVHQGSPPSPRAEAGTGVRIAMLNLRSGYDLDGRFAIERTAALLAAEDPDIVVLNEVDRGWLVHGGHDVLRLLSRELELPAVFAPAADEVWGNAVLSRFPVTEVSVERLPRGVAPMARSQITVVLDLDGTHRLAVVGTHLSRIGGPDDGTRIAQARAVAATVARHRERGQPVVVAGTFNAGPDTAEIETFGSLVSSALPRGMLTSPADDPDALLVQVLLSPDLRRRSSEAPEVVLSEHLPVFVTVELR